MPTHPPTSAARTPTAGPDPPPPDWPAGWSEFVAARRRFLTARARDATVARLERDWRAPAVEHEARTGATRAEA